MRILSIIISFLFVVFIISCKKSEETEIIKQAEQQQQIQELVEQLTKEETIVQAEIETMAADEKAAEIKKAAAEVVNRKRAKLVFNEKEYDYGIIAQGDEVQHDFIFTNKGDADLIIKSADATCGCTTPEYPFIPIKPGETGKIGVKFNSTGKLGSQKPMITLVTNASPRVHRIYLNGFVNAGKKKEEIEQEENVEESMPKENHK